MLKARSKVDSQRVDGQYEPRMSRSWGLECSTRYVFWTQLRLQGSIKEFDKGGEILSKEMLQWKDYKEEWMELSYDQIVICTVSFQFRTFRYVIAGGSCQKILSWNRRSSSMTLLWLLHSHFPAVKKRDHSRVRAARAKAYTNQSGASAT